MLHQFVLHVAGLSNPPELWDYVRCLGNSWGCFAQHLGFPQALISGITTTWSRDLQAQLLAFMRVCCIPDCGDTRMRAILHRINTFVGGIGCPMRNAIGCDKDI